MVARRAAIDVALERENALFGQRHAIAQLVAAGAPDLGVEVRRYRLQVLHEQRLETGERVELAARRVDHRSGRLVNFVMRRDVAVQMIDQGGVEPFLRLERRSD